MLNTPSEQPQFGSHLAQASNSDGLSFETLRDRPAYGNRPLEETLKPIQTDQQPENEIHELCDDQLQSVVGGLQETKIIRIIGFEN